MPSQRHRPRKKKLPWWRARVCSCLLYESSHTIRSKKAWRTHKLLLGKLLAGANDARPRPTPADRSLDDSNLDIGSSIATNPYGGSEYESLRDDEISHGTTLYSSGDIGTMSSSEGVRQDGVFATSLSTMADTTSRAVSVDWAPGPDGGFAALIAQNEPLELEGNGIQTLLLPDILLPSNTTLASTSSPSLEGSSGMASQFSSSDDWQAPNVRGYQAEAAFLEEVEDFIGDPDDWTGSEDESVIGDPFEVGWMKTGFIDEDLLEDTDLGLLDLEEAVADFDLQEDAVTTFVYDSLQGKQTHYHQTFFEMID